MDKPVYSVEDVIAMLGKSRSFVYKMLRQGAIPAKKLGSSYIIPKRVFDNWLQGGTN
jgi:excisionase family DNA binding protein